MQLHSMIVDDWFADFEAVRRWANVAVYADITNPVDGVVYPDICADIPADMRHEVHEKLQLVLNGRVDIKALFARLSVAGVHVPHQAHNDVSMGECSLMVYLNRSEHLPPVAGTELIDHNAFPMEYGPQDDLGLEMWKLDANERKAWFRKSICEARPNRAFIFDARLMHRAQPIGGFGKDATDGRLVLTAFFDLPA